MKNKEVKLTEFQLHQTHCDRCKSVLLYETKSLQNVCLIGAPLLRDQLNVVQSKEVRKINKGLKVAFEDNTRTTKKKLKSVMRYAELSLF
jgi:hypothetical protein